ncbi:hypothetical protein ABID22_000943 [Pontibacter aydingkolensis]|uniref:PH domain-containing protein n=1 Tax=Pontibacter aydingkolensis TaxID=1911536 RepID=A0ABS7CSK8_9BACT|nr:PH domain-containing protein [Pontibacter aydingkolensis]MBW7466804.1 PH domain-containing protein [Pontibacter aydingkolensis]
MKIYKAKKKGFILYLLLGALIPPILVLSLANDIFSEAGTTLFLIIFSLSILPISLLTWIYLDTYYKIENGKLRYKSAFLKGEIDISTIKKVISGQTMWVGVKPALAKNGLIIQYNRFDEIYIAPESNNEVINDLLAVNKDIEVAK